MNEFGILPSCRDYLFLNSSILLNLDNPGGRLYVTVFAYADDYIIPSFYEAGNEGRIWMSVGSWITRIRGAHRSDNIIILWSPDIVANLYGVSTISLISVGLSPIGNGGCIFAIFSFDLTFQSVTSPSFWSVSNRPLFVSSFYFSFYFIFISININKLN